MKTDKTINLKANYIVTKCSMQKIAEFVSGFLGITVENIIANFGEYEKVWLELTKNPTPELKQYQFETHNIVPLVLRKSLASLISGSTVTPTFQANVVALGTSATPVNNNDTQLGVEIKRATFTNRYAIDNIAYLDKFFSSNEVSGFTYLEAGVFVDGDPLIANSGYLLSHINMDETISANETLTINATITIA